MNLNELRNKAYQCAVTHGWHEENLSDEHFLCLVISELMEAVEADRKGMHADIEAFNKYNGYVDFKENFERQIKGTVEDELADVVIRCLYLAGLHSIDLSDAEAMIDKLSEAKIKEDTDATFAELMFEIVKLIFSEYAELDIKINAILLCVVELCKSKKINIDWHIEQKIKYNELRPYKHGDKSY